MWISLHLSDYRHLCSGEPVKDAIKVINDFNIECLLINCNSFDITVNAVDIIVDNWSKLWGVYPNFGFGKPTPNGLIEYIQTDEKFLQIIQKAVDLGAGIIGGCCGSNPGHIALLKKEFFIT